MSLQRVNLPDKIMERIINTSFKELYDRMGAVEKLTGTTTTPPIVIPLTFKVKVGSFTRDTSLASGNQVVTGVGFKPSAVILEANILATSQGSIGYGVPGSNACIANFHADAANTWNNDTYAIELVQGGGAYYLGIVYTLNVDGFTIEWFLIGAKVGTATVRYLAIGYE